ncbi:hypothetical protein L249_6580 [Ophiocordyceps polyrhachis-furcata BCC 54312]|uniref:Uncharacterized protein n=1 Tax=Ophiocordyceps polyrhachis-furcata BCC 54312 TaxID=1330021 RepID=A0A367LJC6_9HYPO|nr:hypothetical protein L249_6580 [Ophiocordyceps polyrhachis-furcata BCC 54312]
MHANASTPSSSMIPTFHDPGVNLDYAAMDQFFSGTVPDAGLIDPTLSAFVGAGSATEPAAGGEPVRPDDIVFPAADMSASNNTVAPSRLSRGQGTSSNSGTQHSNRPDLQGNVPQGLPHFVQPNPSPALLDPGSVLPAPTPYLTQHPQQQPSTEHSTLLEVGLRGTQPASGLPPSKDGQHRQGPYQHNGPSPPRYSSNPAWYVGTGRLNAQGAVAGHPSSPLSSDRQRTGGPHYPLFQPYERPSGRPISLYPPPSYAVKPVPPYGNPGLGPSPLSNVFHGNTAAGPAEQNVAAAIKSPSLYLDLDNSNNNNNNNAPAAPKTLSGLGVAQTWAKSDKCEPSFAVSDEMENGRVMSARAAKKTNSMHKADPSNVYKEHDRLPKSKPFGPRSLDGRPLFTYTKDGQLAEDRVYSKEELQIYLDDHRSVLWIQQSPAQCASRLHYDDRRCRWDKCPLASRVIGSGWFRVAFDEHPQQTTKGGKDPFKVAGIMHLWCFEQCFDIVDFFVDNRVRPDTRILPRETGNAMSINRDSDREIVREAFDPWFDERRRYRKVHGVERMPRQHHDTLSYRLSKHHVENQTGARQKARDNRNKGRPWKERTTIDVHLGDLQVYVYHSNYKKNAKRKKNRAGGNTDGGGRRASLAKRRGSSFVAEMVNGSVPMTGAASVNGGFGVTDERDFLPRPSGPVVGNVPQAGDDHLEAAARQELKMMSDKEDVDNEAIWQRQPWQTFIFDETDSNPLMNFVGDPAFGPVSSTAMSSQDRTEQLNEGPRKRKRDEDLSETMAAEDGERPKRHCTGASEKRKRG